MMLSRVNCVRMVSVCSGVATVGKFILTASEASDVRISGGVGRTLPPYHPPRPRIEPQRRIRKVADVDPPPRIVQRLHGVVDPHRLRLVPRVTIQIAVIALKPLVTAVKPSRPSE